ncbi:glycerophosphodiester phosphodiesterase family protein [Rhodobacteraceae bacterium]|nr:glycerophosphodiester phosphodiesterase family protein [Paracoccaceae bacterium]
MRRALSKSFLTRPLAHRGLHDSDDSRLENSLPAIEAAIAAGYGIEIDVQMTSDACAVVFHDYKLNRLTLVDGLVRDHTQSELTKIELKASSGHIPTLAQVLERVAGRVPLLVEIKDQDGNLGTDVGPLEMAVASDLAQYTGSVAVMSFNPHSVAAMQALLPDVPRGLVTAAFEPDHWPMPRTRALELANIPDFNRVGASFISHDSRDLKNPRVVVLRKAGANILCWTIRSPQEEAEARKVAENVTFEGYLPPVPA